MPTDAEWLACAARLAQRARPQSCPNPAVGAIIIHEGQVVGRGWTQAGGRPHAEAVALAMAGPMAEGATLYATLEPCAHQSSRGPSCASLIADSGLARCVYGLRDPDPRTSGAGHAAMERAGIAVQQIDCDASARSLAGYLMQRQARRPFITLKLAMSLDGCIALASGESQWITGKEARAHVHRQRALQDGIVVGGGTWREDTPQLNVRLPGLEHIEPRRFVLTRSAGLEGADALASPEAVHTLSDMQYLYLEGGAGAAAAFLQADLVDQIDIYRAPIVIGGGKPGLTDIGLESLAEAHGRWVLDEQCQLGSDHYQAYRRTR